MKKDSKNNKKKFRLLILLLLLTVVMFSTATYAWFTANQTVTVSSLDVHVEASNGLQISTNAADWKTVITNSDITTGYTGNKNQVPSTLSAVSTDGTVDATTGKLNMYFATVGSDESTGEYNLTATKDTDVAGSTGHYVAFDMFLKLDSAKPVYLTTDSSVKAKGESEDKGLKNASRVGFVTLGNAAADTAVATVQALNTAATTATIWEPNADTHTSYGTAAATELGITINDKTNRTSYFGLKNAVPTAVNLKETVNGKSTTNTAEVTPTIVTPATYAGTYDKAFDLKAGITKIRVYMWIEGQDVDCENNASGTDISFALQFSTQSSAA